MHKMVSYCEEGKHIATAACPASSVKQIAVLDYERPYVSWDGSMKDDQLVPSTDDGYLLQTLSKDPVCPAHKELPTPPKPVDPDKPDPNKPNPDKPDPSKPDPDKPDPDKPDPDKPDPGEPDPDPSGPDKPTGGDTP